MNDRGATGAIEAGRFDRLRRLVREAGLAGAYVTAGANFRWLTGERAHPGGWPLGSRRCSFLSTASPRW